MAKYFFYTDEGYTVSPNNTDLDSLQILGIESGQTLQEGMNKLIENNHWIVENNFKIENIKYRIVINHQDIDNLKSIIDYLWDDEEKHFKETDAKGKRTHIFLKLKALKRYCLSL